jgi:GNAT superfamily N-acetyltransferase
MVRPARLDDSEGIARVQVASWRTTYPGMIPQDFLDSMDDAAFAGRWSERLSHETSRRTTFVAEDEGRLVGFATGGAEREGDAQYDGELYAIYVLQEWQGQGLGRELVNAVAGALVERGLHSMLVWVLRDNLPARAFYERLGGVYVREHPLDFGAGFEVMEVSYGWGDVRGGLSVPDSTRRPAGK